MYNLSFKLNIHYCSLPYTSRRRGKKLGIDSAGCTELLSSPWGKGNWRQDVCESLKLHSCDYLLQCRCPKLPGILAPAM